MRDIKECFISQNRIRRPDLLAGIIAIRKMHIRAIEESGLTSADEMLYPENRSYLDDILSYEAIGRVLLKTSNTDWRPAVWIFRWG